MRLFKIYSGISDGKTELLSLEGDHFITFIQGIFQMASTSSLVCWLGVFF